MKTEEAWANGDESLQLRVVQEIGNQAKEARDGEDEAERA